MIGIEDFQRLDIRIGIVREASDHPNANRLLVLKVDTGEAQPRTLVAGIRGAYDAASLVGRTVVVLANLQPRALRGVTSEGMVLAATDARTSEVVLLTADKAVAPGSKIS
jgi:methionyl-tRNA synthetase